MAKHDIDILLVQLRDGRAATRAEAARTLSEYPSPLGREDLVRCLGDRDERVRYWSVRALDALAEPRGLAAVPEKLQDPSSAVRMVASRALARHPRKEALGELLEALGDPEADVVHWASRALAALGDYAVPQLVSSLGHIDWRRREAAADALVRIGSGATEALVAALDHENPDRVYWAIRCLGRLRVREAATRIRVFLDGSRRDLASAAMRTLGALGDRDSLRRIVAFLGHPDPWLRGEAVESLAEFGDFAVKLLADLLDGNRRVVKLAAAEALGASGHGALVPILEKLREDSAELRYWAVRALEKFSSPVVVPLLLDLLADEAGDVQLAAAEALGSFALERESAPRLLAVLASEDWRVRQAAARSAAAQEGWGPDLYAERLADSDEDVRFWVARILGERGKADGIPLLLQCFDDASWPIRKAAAEGLGRMGKAAVPAIRQAMAQRAGDANQRYWLTRSLIGVQELSLVPGLVTLLDDGDSGVRQNAAEALRAMGEDAVPDLLGQLRTVESRALREGIAKVLVAIRTRRIQELLELLGFGDPEVDHWVTWILGALGDVALPYLGDKVRSGSERDRHLALRALYWIEHPRSVELALEVMDDEFPSIRRLAVRILGRNRVKDASGTLLEVLAGEDDDLRVAAVEALGRTGGEGVRQALEGLLASERWEVQKAAVEALRTLGERAAAPALRRLLDPEHRDLWGFAARALGELGAGEDATRIGEVLAEADPRDLPLLLEALGKLAVPESAARLRGFLGHPFWEIREAAIEAYGQLGPGVDPAPLKAMAQDPEDPLLRGRAREALRRVVGEGAWEKTLRSLMQKVLDDPAADAYRQATELLGAEDRPGAERELRKALRIAKRSEYYALLGSLCLESGRRGEAERCLVRAAALAPGDPVPLVKLGVLQASIGKERKAVTTLRRVLALPDLPVPIRDLAHRTLSRLGDVDATHP